MIRYYFLFSTSGKDGSDFSNRYLLGKASPDFLFRTTLHQMILMLFDKFDKSSFSHPNSLYIKFQIFSWKSNPRQSPLQCKSVSWSVE